MRGIFTTILQGIGIGVANVIPGVSGGTMALIFGIYERLISVAAAVVHVGVLLTKLDFKSAYASLKELPWVFVVPLIIGIVIAPLAGARFIPDLLDLFPEESRAVFFGLILGSIAIPWLRIKNPSTTNGLFAAIAGIAAFYIAGLPVIQPVNPSLLYVFVAGAVAMSAMILPGVSGAYLLLVMGLYSPILRAIDQLDISVVLVFMAGAAIGVAAFSIFIGWLLKTRHDQTMAVLVGLMIGSLRALWPWLGPDRELRWLTGNSPAGQVLLYMTTGLLISGGILVWELRKKRPKHGKTVRAER